MAIRQIVKVGDDLLRKRSKEVTVFDERLGELIDDMTETMFYANGVGIAAPQIGLLKRIAVVSVDGDKIYELVNPEIIKASGTQCGTEGCLSVPGVNGEVVRPKKVAVKALDRKGQPHVYKVSDYEAVAFCHEIDHLDGVLFVDKMKTK